MSENKRSQYQLIDNEKGKQYEFHIGNMVAKIEYIKAKNKIFLTHTEVPEKLGGQGIASALVKAVFEDIAKKEKIVSEKMLGSVTVTLNAELIDLVRNNGKNLNELEAETIDKISDKKIENQIYNFKNNVDSFDNKFNSSNGQN